MHKADLFTNLGIRRLNQSKYSIIVSSQDELGSVGFPYNVQKLPDRPFHNFRALKSVDRRFQTSQDLFHDGVRGT